MTSIILTVTGAKAQASVSGPLTAGMVGIPVTIEYDEAWKGLRKNLVCRCGQWGPEKGETRTILNVAESATVAHEVMQADMYLYLAIEGCTDDGKLVVPTTWASCGKIQHGADVGADPSVNPRLAVWNQLQTEIKQIRQESVTQDQVEDIYTWAQTASQAAFDAEQARERAVDASNIAISNANTAKAAAVDAENARKSASLSAQTAVNMANGALQAQRAAEAAAQNVRSLPEYSGSDNGKVLGIVDGIPAWVEATASGGGTAEPEVTTHGIVWDLVNVTSSNNAASVNDGASLSAVLTPADGYTLGDVTVTMGGEVLTGAWNADTSIVTIASVTGDVVISCAGVEKSTGETADTSPVIAHPNSKMSGENYVSASSLSVTKVYEYSYDNDAVKALAQYDAANDYIKTAGYQGGIRIYLATENHLAAGGAISNSENDWGNMPMRYRGDGVTIVDKNTYGSAKNNEEHLVQSPNSYSAMCNSQVIGIEFTLYAADVEGSYAYWTKPYTTSVLPIGVNAGDIIFAGKDSPYYGMKNIDGTMLNEASVAELSFDEDYAQDYSVATTSMLGDDPAAGADVYAGVSDEFAAVINTAKKEWMTEYGGDYRKIPLIVSTDQHGRVSGIFNLLARILNMHDVSKICNLGDTVTDKWYDADADKPLLTCAELETWAESMKMIPFSKQLNVFGNHDAWYGNGTTAGNAVGTAYPSNLSHLDQYFRNIYARRTNNNGWFAIKDDYFNVKYLVVTGLEWVDDSVNYRTSTAQMKWMIEELSANDGYDVVIVSHVPLKYDDTAMTQPTGDTNTSGAGGLSNVDTDAFFAARKTKGSGTITDSEGVTHTYDFGGCTTELLCSLHGHLHCDAYLYLENQLLVNCFDWFPYETFFMVLVDRVGRQLNIWKIDNTPQYVNYQIPLDKPGE